MSRYLGAEKVGIYYLALTVTNIAIVVSMVGLNNSLVKYSAQSFANHDWKTLVEIHNGSIAIVAITSFIAMLLIIVLAPWLAGNIFHKQALCNPLRYVAITIIPINLVAIYVSIFKGLKKIISATVAESLYTSLFMILLLIAFREILSVSIVGMLLLAATGTNLIIARAVWHKTASSQGVNKKRIAVNKKLLQTSWPLYAVALMNMVMSMSDVVMLGLWKDSHVIGIYGVAVRITSVSSMFLVIVNTIVAPRFSILYDRGDHESLSNIARFSTLFMVVIAAFFLILFISIPDFILYLFGEEFVSGKNIVIILAVGQFVVLSTGPVAALLMMTGNEIFHRNTTIFSAALNIALNYMLIPVYGGVGAAFATAFSLSLKNILAVMHVRKRLRIRVLI